MAKFVKNSLYYHKQFFFQEVKNHKNGDNYTFLLADGNWYTIPKRHCKSYSPQKQSVWLWRRGAENVGIPMDMPSNPKPRVPITVMPVLKGIHKC